MRDEGIGRRLLDTVRRWAAEQGLTTLSLTTFAEVPWNGPYYARLGFSVVPEERLGVGLRAIRAAETAKGLDAWPRITMSTTVGDDQRWPIEHE